GHRPLSLRSWRSRRTPARSGGWRQPWGEMYAVCPNTSTVEQVSHELGRQAVGFVQVGQFLIAKRPTRLELRKHTATTLQQRGEPSLLRQNYLAHWTIALAESRQSVADQRVRQVTERPGRVNAPQDCQRAPEQPAQHVPAPGVRRLDAVGDDHDARAQVIGE